MKTSVVAIVALFASALAGPTAVEKRQYVACTSGSAYCCDVNVLDLADLDCSAPPTTPTSRADFQSQCAAEGKIDICCDLDLLDQGLLCSAPE